VLVSTMHSMYVSCHVLIVVYLSMSNDVPIACPSMVCAYEALNVGASSSTPNCHNRQTSCQEPSYLAQRSDLARKSRSRCLHGQSSLLVALCGSHTYFMHSSSAHTTRSATRRIPTTPCLFYVSRSFSISSPLYKKAGKANKAHAQTDSSPPVSNPGSPTPTDDAYDVSGLEAQILKAIEKLTHDLSQLRGGGKLNPEVVESLKVQLGTAGQGKETVRLGDIAQVVPRGRTMNVVCGEEAVRPMYI
jgi:hypothetical protein